MVVKYKAWDRVNKEMIFPELIRISGTGLIEIDNGKEWVKVDEDRVEIFMFTGEQDLLNKDLYDKDIVACSAGENDTIVFYNGCFKLRRRAVTLEYYVNELHQELVRVGNVFENPELIK